MVMILYFVNNIFDTTSTYESVVVILFLIGRVVNAI